MSRHVVVQIEGLVFDYRLNESDLKSEFSKYGTVVDVMLLDDQVAPDIAIIEYKNSNEAERAVSTLDKTQRNIEGYTGILRVVLMTPSVERALLVKAHILASSIHDELIDPYDNFNRHHRYTCRYVVGAERMNQEYSVIGRILGVGGENVKMIHKATGCNVRINGKQKSDDEPLNVRVVSDNPDSFAKGREMTEALITDMYQDYEKWCERHYIPVAPIRLRVVEGQETLRPLGRIIQYSFD